MQTFALHSCPKIWLILNSVQYDKWVEAKLI